MVFSPMLDAHDWPAAYAQYSGGIVVMNPFNASAATVAKVRADLNAKVVMYWDTEDIQIKAAGRCLSPGGNTNIATIARPTGSDAPAGRCRAVSATIAMRTRAPRAPTTISALRCGPSTRKS